MGNDFFLIGYRIFVKYKNSNGKIFRGLYILKSETNKKKMEFFGNIFTHYNYATTDIVKKESKENTSFESVKSKFNFAFSDIKEEVSYLPILLLPIGKRLKNMLVHFLLLLQLKKMKS